MIDRKLAESLKFIKEGEFNETLGAPTLKLVGEVSPVTVRGAAKTVISYAPIFQEDILNKFLEQTKVDEPIQYIYAGLAQSRIWLPVFYYARMSAKTNGEVTELVRVLKVAQKGKVKVLLDRLERRRSAFTPTVTKLANSVAKEIAKGRIEVPSSVKGVLPFAQGLTAVKDTAAPLKDLLLALLQCKQMAEAADDGNAMGAIFKAACWIDELFFAESKNKK